MLTLPAPFGSRLVRLLVLTLVVGSLAQPRARAQGASAEIGADDADKVESKSPPEAVERYRRGREHYLAGRYREALHELLAALRLDPDSANLVYNVARVNEDLGELDQAIEYYERYLRLLPGTEAQDRDKTKATIRRLRGAREELAARRNAEESLRIEPPRDVSEPRGFGRADLAFWLCAGAGVALAAGGGVIGMLSLSRQDDVGRFVVGRDGSYAERAAIAAQAETLALTSDMLFLGGALSLTGAALLFFLRRPEERASAARLDASFDGRRALLRLSGEL